MSANKFGLEDTLLQNASRSLQMQIDREILWAMLTEIGWTRVGYYSKSIIGQAQIDEINAWVRNNSKGSYETFHADFIFENSKDAVNFILRWYD